MTEKEVKISKTMLSLLFIAFLTGIDQLTKLLAVSFLKAGGGIVLIRDILELEYFENTGAAFNSLAGQRILLILVTVPVITFLAGKLSQMMENRRYSGMRFCICLIIAGAAGNLIDRLVRGYVVDFIYFMPVDFPKFNFADMCVVGGAVLLGLLLVVYYREEDLNFLLNLQGR